MFQSVLESRDGECLWLVCSLSVLVCHGVCVREHEGECDSVSGLVWVGVEDREEENCEVSKY